MTTEVQTPEDVSVMIMEEERLEVAPHQEPPEQEQESPEVAAQQEPLLSPQVLSIDIPSTRWTNDEFVDGLDELNLFNIFFVIAVFIGTSMETLGQQSLQTNVKCDAGPNVTMGVIKFVAITFGILGFSIFLIFTVRSAVKHLKAHNCVQLKRNVLKWGLMLASCATKASVGCFLYSINSVVQVRLGLASCGSKHTVTTFWVMDLFIALGVMISLCQTAYFAWAA